MAEQAAPGRGPEEAEAGPGAAGGDAPAPPAAASLAPLSGEGLEELKASIMAEIEAKLLQKEESLWRRGQVEIRKLQLEQQQVATNVSKLQERQASLNTESQKLRGALLEIASKFETVVREMREVIRTHSALVATGGAAPAPPGGTLSPSPSAASTATSEAGRDDLQTRSEPAAGTASSLGPWSADRLALQGLALVEPPSLAGGYSLPFDPCEDPATFLTPPRAAHGGHEPCDFGCLGLGPPSLGPLGGGLPSPTPPLSWRTAPPSAPGAGTVLSLADALPPVPALGAGAPSPMAPTPSPGLKRLHLAECLGQDVGPTSAAPHSATRSAELPGGLPRQGGVHVDVFTMELVKEQGFVTLGIEVNQIDAATLRVECVDEHGLVGRHNLRQDSDATRVLLGDRIVEVNGVRQDPNRMLDECKVQQRVRLTLLRPRQGSQGAPDAAAMAAGMPLLPAVSQAHGEPPPTPPRRRMRPEAEVFVPSCQKEPGSAAPTTASSAAAGAAPPGLGPLPPPPSEGRGGDTASPAPSSEPATQSQSQVPTPALPVPAAGLRLPGATKMAPGGEDLVKRLFP